MIRIDLKNLIAGGRLNLTNVQIKKVAEQMLADYSPAALESPQAVDIDGFITDYLGFKMRYACLTNNMSILGATTFADDEFIFFDPATQGIKKEIVAKNTVIIDTRMLEGSNKVRYSYTAAHECGHIVFDNPGVRKQADDNHRYMMECAEELCDFSPSDKPKDDKWWIEHYCDYFASCLILPEKTVRMAAMAILKKHDYSTCVFTHSTKEQQFCVDVLAKGVAEIFETSKEAAFYKLCGLKIIRGDREFFKKMKAKYK